MAREIVSEVQASNNIKAFRVKKGLKQAEIAELLGMSRNGYVKWENHPYNIPVDYLYRIASCLDCSIEDFILA